ncbi:hypothetical protein SAMN05192533_102160 [Mesobacillus persicus]|uniref:Uncharacterized protein n=1 Tax=Mesobacillus persicus TaxID=930146 RepID=A0A1H7XDE1_9BACI|nr:hypothetical protein SAMN05192533_102160 [Mesobacillus persicus]
MKIHMKREEKSWLKTFLHDDLMNEHLVGSFLKVGFATISRRDVTGVNCKSGRH